MGNSLSDDVRDLLDRWLKARENRSLQTLADAINGIKYNTIRRIYIGQVAPSMQTCLALLNHIASPDEAASFMVKHFSDFGKFYQRLDGADRKVKTAFSAQIEVDWTDLNVFMLVSFALMRKASPENIKKFLGDAGLVTADELCRKGVLSANEDDFVMANGAELCVSQDPGNLFVAFSHLLKIFRARMNTPFVNLVNVNTNEAEIIKRMVQQVIREAAAIIDRSEGGDEIIALGILYGNLTEGFI